MITAFTGNGPELAKDISNLTGVIMPYEMTESEAKEQRQKQLSAFAFNIGKALVTAQRPERKRVENREVEKCQEK